MICGSRFREIRRLVGGVVEDLNLQTITRIIHRRRGVNQPFDDVSLIIDGKLHGDGWPFAGSHSRPIQHIAAMVPKEDGQKESLEAVDASTR